jgi:nitroreductase
MKFGHLIKKRRSVKKFRLDKKPDWRKILRALNAARFIPAAGNQYNIKWILIREESIIEQLGQASQQPFVGKASYVVACVSDPSVLVRSYGEVGERYTAQQAGASIENFLLALTEQGLATTWVGHFYEDMVKGLLGVDDKMIVEAIFPIGIAAANASSKEPRKTPLDSIMFFDKWGNKYMDPKVLPSRHDT